MNNIDLNKQMQELVKREKQSRARLAKNIREINRRQLWKKSGNKSIMDYCISKLRMDEHEAREVLIQAGIILTQNQLTDQDATIQKRIDALKQWRKEVAAEKDISAYLVIPNRTILDIARRNPTSKEQLAEVKGIGQKKLESYCRPILKCIG